MENNKQTKTEAVEETKKAVEEKAEATAAAKGEVTSAEASLSAAKEALKTAEQEKAGDAKVMVEEANKEKRMTQECDGVGLPSLQGECPCRDRHQQGCCRSAEVGGRVRPRHSHADFSTELPLEGASLSGRP